MIKTILITSALLAFTACSTTKSNSTASSTVQTTSTPKPIVMDADMGKLTCTKKKETRTLEVIKDGSGCNLEYTKSGKMKVAASSKKGLKHCVESKKKIRTNLEKAGYSCS